MSKKQKTWIAVGVSVVVIIALVLVIASIRSQNSSTAAAYQTTTVQVGTLTSSVEGTGTVASTQSVNLTWLTSGQVGQVMAHIGDQVKAGDVLATLLQSSLPQNMLVAQTNLVTAQRNLDTAQNSGTAAAQASLNLVTAQQTFNTAKANYDTLISQSHGATTGNIENMQAQITIAQSNLDKAQSAYDAVSDLPDSDPRKAQAYTALYNAQQVLATLQANLNGLQSAPSAINIQKTQATMELAQAQLADAQRAWDLLKNGPDANAIAAAQAQVLAAQELINEAQITAPFDGTITQSNVISNAVVSAGTQAFRLDNLSSLVVPVSVTEIDINGIQAGQPATITFDAIPNKTYNGTVTKTDLAGTVGQNNVNFSVTVQISDADAQIKPGMAANVTIVTNQVADALLIPSTSIFTDTSGQQYVYLVQNGVTTTVPVTVGAISDSTTQITNSNLKEGDTIILSFASTSSTSGGGFGFGGMGGMVGGGDRSQPVVTP
jgi:HlyD family secretion protein